jgi:hypothetical protein
MSPDPAFRIPASGIDDAKYFAADDDRGSVVPPDLDRRPERIAPVSNGMLRGTKWVWMSMASAKTLPRSRYALKRVVPNIPQAFAAILLYKQVGLFLLCLQSKNNCRPRQSRPGSETDENRTLSAPIENIVIAGCGQAGGRAAEALRAKGFQGAITMLGEEPHPPYERPQLSKEMLHAADAPITYIKQAGDWHDKLGVRLETGAAVTDCDTDRRTVSTADGRAFAFDRLLIATGTRPRRFAAIENCGLDVQYLRNVEDALRFRRSIQHKSRIVIVGGGVIGLEAACAAATMGCAVTVIESEQRLLARAFPSVVSDLVAAKHRSHRRRFRLRRDGQAVPSRERRDAPRRPRDRRRSRAGRHWRRIGADSR